jgi:hypothetical protein
VVERIVGSVTSFKGEVFASFVLDDLVVRAAFEELGTMVAQLSFMGESLELGSEEDNSSDDPLIELELNNRDEDVASAHALKKKPNNIVKIKAFLFIKPSGASINYNEHQNNYNHGLEKANKKVKMKIHTLEMKIFKQKIRLSHL